MITPVMPTYGRWDVAVDHGEGRWLYSDRRPQIPRFHQRDRGDRARPLPSASGGRHPAAGRAAMAHLEPVPHSRAGKAGPAAGRKFVRRYRVLWQFGGRGVRIGDKGRAQVPVRDRPSRALSHHRVRRLVPRPHLCDLGGGRETRAYLKGFGPPMDGFDHVAFGNLNEMRAAIGRETAAIIVEPVQGEGGVRPGSDDYLRGLRAIADEFGLLLIFDEVQCGMGRTGKLFAYEWSGVAPDVMAVAKALGGGFPIGACLATERAAVGMVPGTHGSTFGGNPLAVAAGNAVLDVMLEPGFLDRVDATAKMFRGRLAALVKSYPKLFAELRGSGLLLGIRCVVPAGDIVTRLRENGLLALTAGDNVLRLLPPLIVSEAEIGQAMDILQKVAREWSA